MAYTNHKVTIETGKRNIPYKNTTLGQLFTRDMGTGDKDVYLSRQDEGPVSLRSGLFASITQEEQVYPLSPGARVVIVVGEHS